jgi:F-type H+-transporting ATPase subunit b
VPQLEQIDTFFAQIFWLFVCFGVVFLFISKFAAPKLGGVIELRENTISSDINSAESFKNSAVQVNSEFEKRSAESKAEAFNLISTAAKNANALYDKGISHAEAELKKQVESSEKDINISKGKAEAELAKNTEAYVNEIVSKLTGGKNEKKSVEKIVSKINS